MKNLFSSLLLALLCLSAKAQTEPSFQVWTDDNLVLTADSKTVTLLTVYEHDTINYTGFNFSLNVPEGIKLASYKQGRDTVNWVKLTDRAKDHGISSAQVNDTLIKVISVSFTLSDYYTDDADGNPLDAICTVGLIADSTMYNGEYTIELNGCKFATSSNDASVPEESIFIHLTVIGGRESSTTGLDALKADATAGTTYDLQGRRVEPRRPGLYIRNNKKQIIK